MIPFLTAVTAKKGKSQNQPINTAISYLILGAGGYLLIKFAAKELRGAFQKQKNDNLYKEEIDPAKKLTYKPSQYASWADKIEDACNGTPWDPTDEEAIYKVMYYLKNNNDWLELNRAFSIRRYYASQFSTGTDKNLVGFLQSDLDTSEKSKVNNILKSNGITYRV